MLWSKTGQTRADLESCFVRTVVVLILEYIYNPYISKLALLFKSLVSSNSSMSKFDPLLSLSTFNNAGPSQSPQSNEMGSKPSFLLDISIFQTGCHGQSPDGQVGHIRSDIVVLGQDDRVLFRDFESVDAEWDAGSYLVGHG